MVLEKLDEDLEEEISVKEEEEEMTEVEESCEKETLDEKIGKKRHGKKAFTHMFGIGGYLRGDYAEVYLYQKGKCVAHAKLAEKSVNEIKRDAGKSFIATAGIFAAMGGYGIGKDVYNAQQDAKEWSKKNGKQALVIDIQDLTQKTRDKYKFEFERLMGEKRNKEQSRYQDRYW